LVPSKKNAIFVAVFSPIPGSIDIFQIRRLRASGTRNSYKISKVKSYKVYCRGKERKFNKENKKSRGVFPRDF
jgi:hypothetical protein